MKNIKYLLVAFILVALISPNFSSAATIEELIAKIKELQQQIEQLKIQLIQTLESSTSTAGWCHDFKMNLKIMNRGEDVSTLHSVLEKEGFIVFEKEKAEKQFGSSTAAAVSHFQLKYQEDILAPLGLKYGTGFFGNATRLKLNRLYGCEIKKATPPPFCSPLAVSCESGSKIVCPAGLSDKGCPFPCKCVPVACTQDVKICPDGTTTVSRITPSCAFAPCPGENTNQAPIIYGVRGPAILKIGEIGSWVIRARDPENGSLKYDVCWGDGSCGMPAGFNQTLTSTTTQNFTFTHSYSTAGVFSPTFTVIDEQGSSTNASINVKVQETNSTSTVSEQVQCMFRGARTEQKCFTSTDSSSVYYGYRCSGREACNVNMKGTKEDKITWTSSCGGYAFTTMDGISEYAMFSCATSTAENTSSGQ